MIVCMKVMTTLKIDQIIMSRLKKESVRRGKTIYELLESALRLFFQSEKHPKKIPPLPKFKSGGAFIDIADRNALYRAMEEK